MGMSCGGINTTTGYGTCGGGNSWDTGKTKGVKSTSKNTGGGRGTAMSGTKLDESRILREEINRNRELMGTINESQLLLERPLTKTQRRGFGNCAMFGGSFWCANGADECATILESGDDGACTGSITPGTTDIKLDLDKDLQTRTAGPEPTDKRDVELGINEGLLLEGKKFWRQLEACREEIADGGGEDNENEYGGGKHCRKFSRNYM